MYNRKISNFLRKTKSNSGFTLTELLTGLIMSIFVTGALGFGLYQILQLTAREEEKTNTRNEASRAVEFISDEMRRASFLDGDLLADLDGDGTEENTAPDYTTDASHKIVLALRIPELNNSIIYYLKSTDLGSWQGPQVLYRWGPPLNASGEYTTGTWQHEALIDGIDNTTITTNPCGADTLTPPMASSPSGFYACVNGTNTAAQIFLTGGIDTIAGNDTDNDEKYTAQTRAVVRSKNVNVNNAVTGATIPITFRSLEADYVCNIGGDVVDTSDDSIWTMRTDFDNSAYDPDATYDSSDPSASRTDDGMNNATKWIHENNRQPQPINIDPNQDLIIHSIPIEATDCLNADSGNEGATDSDDLSGFLDTGYTVSHAIRLQENVVGRPGDSQFYKSFNGNTTGGYDNPNVKDDGTVQVFKEGSKIKEGVLIDISSNNAKAPLYAGYDPDGSGPAPYRQSLGEFLVSKGYATYNGVDEYTITGLEPKERIIAVEIGHKDTEHPGFDIQDSVFIMSHDIFAETH